MLQVVDLAACEFEPGSASQVMLGRESGGMIIYDLEAQRPAAKVPLNCFDMNCRNAHIAYWLPYNLVAPPKLCYVAFWWHCITCMPCHVALHRIALHCLQVVSQCSA